MAFEEVRWLCRSVNEALKMVLDKERGDKASGGETTDE